MARKPTYEELESRIKQLESECSRLAAVNPVSGNVREVHAIPIRDTEGRVTKVVKYARDITKLKHAQEEDRQRQRFLESVLTSVPDAIITLNAQHRVIDWNPGAVKMFGYTRDRAIGQQLDDLVARDEHRAEAAGKTRLVLSGRSVKPFETVRYHKNGTPLHVMASGSPILIDNNLVGIVAVYTDITDRVHAETALRESEERFRTLVEQSPLGIALIGKGGCYQYINPAFQNMFGYSIVEVSTGSAWFRKAFPDKRYRSMAIQAWLADLEKSPIGQSRTRIFKVTCKDGALKDILFRPVTMENMNQFVLFENITENKKLERQFQQAQKFKAIGTLAGGVAHDFNNLLMGIYGRTSLIMMDLKPSNPHMDHLQAIEEHVRSATALTKQLLGLARGGKYEVKAVDINELLTDSSKLFCRTKKEIRIRIQIHPQPLVVAVDRGQIEQVLLNLYVNAWQAMLDGGDLYLETKSITLDEATCSAHQVSPGRYAMVSIKDSGTGMDEATRLRIFDPFFTTKKKERGTGLGLASAYGIIKNHNGFITVNSEKGYGATFIIYLPLSDKEVADEAPKDRRLIKGTGTILLVDDEVMILTVGQALLEKLGYRVITAEGGQKAVNVIEKMKNEIDLVILDLIMPGMDGGKAFDRIRRIQPQTPVLLSSGYTLKGQVNAILKRGCNGFIQKPFNMIQLSEKVRQLLDG
jgi:PAS domain S-box-containing protein